MVDFIMFLSSDFLNNMYIVDFNWLIQFANVAYLKCNKITLIHSYRWRSARCWRTTSNCSTLIRRQRPCSKGSKVIRCWAATGRAASQRCRCTCQVSDRTRIVMYATKLQQPTELMPRHQLRKLTQVFKSQTRLLFIPVWFTELLTLPLAPSIG